MTTVDGKTLISMVLENGMDHKKFLELIDTGCRGNDILTMPISLEYLEAELILVQELIEQSNMNFSIKQEKVKAFTLKTNEYEKVLLSSPSLEQKAFAGKIIRFFRLLVRGVTVKPVSDQKDLLGYEAFNLYMACKCYLEVQAIYNAYQRTLAICPEELLARAMVSDIVALYKRLRETKLGIVEMSWRHCLTIDRLVRMMESGR